MATMKSATVKIPVALELSLKDISSQIASMRKMLGSIAPNTNLFSNLTKQIDVLEKKYKELNIAANNSFSTPTQINNFENKLLGLEGGMKNFIDTIKQVNFEDFNLTGDQVKGLTELQNKIKSLDASIDELNKSTIKDLFGGELGKTVRSLGVSEKNDPQKVYQTIIDAYEESNKKLQALNNEKNELIQEQNNLNQQIQDGGLQERQTQGINAINDLSKLHQRVSYYYTSKKYQPGGQEKIAQKTREYVEQGLLTEEEAKQITDATGQQLEQILFDLMQQKGQMIAQLKNEAKGKIDNKQSEIDTEEQRNNLLEQARNRVAESSAQANSQWNQLEDAGRALEDYVNMLIEAKLQTMGVSQATEQMNESFDDARSGVQNMRGELDQLSSSAQALDNIKSAVTQWFGFNEVINFTKRQIGEAIQVIRDLDSAMTEIAVVTDMTQSDLWAQMDTYKSLAQQYGTTIKGVYEVSQLYYQQGLQTAEVMGLTEQTLIMAKISGLDYATATDYMTVA